MFDLDHLKVDPQKAQEGTWVDYYKGSSLLISRSNNKEAEQYRIEQAIENADVFNAGGEKAEQLAFEVETYVLAHFVLRDWDGITRGGKPIDYTPEIGMEFLADEKFADFRDDVLRFSRNREHFRETVEAEAVAAVKPTAAS